MQQGRQFIVWFGEVTKNDVALVGGKGANLGEMTRAKIPVPPGYIVTADAYACTLFGKTADEIPYVRLAAEMGLGEVDWTTVEVREIEV